MRKTNRNLKKRAKNTKKVIRKIKKTLRHYKKRYNRKTHKGGNCRSNPLEFASYPLSESGGSLMELPISTRNTRQIGGSRMLTKLMPQDLLNFGRSIQGGFTGLMNGWNGVETQPSNNPMPTNQPIDVNYSYIGGTPVDVVQIHQEAGNKVAGI